MVPVKRLTRSKSTQFLKIQIGKQEQKEKGFQPMLLQEFFYDFIGKVFGMNYMYENFSSYFSTINFFCNNWISFFSSINFVCIYIFMYRGGAKSVHSILIVRRCYISILDSNKGSLYSPSLGHQYY